MKPGSNRLVIGVILLLIGIAVYLAIDLDRSGREQVLRQFNTMQLLLAQEASHEAVLLFKDHAAHLETLARLASIQRGDAPGILADLERYPQRPEAARFASITVVNTNGDVAFSSLGIPGANFGQAEFFEWSKLKKNRGTVFISSWVRMAGATNEAQPGGVILARPLYQATWDSESHRSVQAWSGALMITVDLEGFLTEHLAPLSLKGSPVRVWIMDRDGTILLQSEHPEMVSANIFRPQFECMECHVSFNYARDMIESQAGTTAYQLKDQPQKLAAFVPLRFADALWTLVVNAPYDEVTAFVDRAYRKTLLLLGTVVAILSLASVMVYRTNLSRVRAKEDAKHWQQKHQLEEELRRAEERYRTLFEQSPVGILMLDPETLVPIEFNDAAHQQLGYSREEFSRMSAAEHAVHGAPADTKARYAEFLRSGRARFEIEQRSREGKLRTIEVIAQTLTLADRTVLHCIHHDITERKRAEDMLTGRTAQLEALHEVSLSITAEIDTSALLNVITHKALTLFRGTSAGLWLHRRGTDELERLVDTTGESAPAGYCLKRGQSLAGRCWEKGAPLVVADRQRWDGNLPAVGGNSWTAAMAAPLRWGDAFLGVLEIHADVAGSFGREDAALLALFATQAAIAIKNAGLLERVRREENIKTTLLHDVSHRVKNNLARLLQIIRLERERAAPANEGCHAALADLEDRLRGMELVHTMLSTSQWRPLPLRDLVTQVVTGALSGSPIRERIRVLVMTPGESLQIAPEQATAIALILSELATNSVKHAFDGRAEGRLEVKLAVEGEVDSRPTIRLRFRDDGPGWPEDILSGRSQHVGLHLIQASVRSPLRGVLALRNDGGAVAEVAFKLALVE